MGKIHYKRSLKYILEKKYEIKIDHPAIKNHGRVRKFVGCELCGKLAYSNNTLIIYKGFQWDGASGPVIDTKSIIRASLVHDALYTILESYAYNKANLIKADEIFREICIEDGMNKAQAQCYYLGLQLYNSFRVVFDMHKNMPTKYKQ